MLVGLMGKMGTGKTHGMTVLGIYLHKMTGAPIYANYTLNGVPYTRISSLKELWQINGGIVLLDELWLSMDARMWKDNVAITRFINQTRKKKITLLYTTQHIRQIELRTRNATDILIYCEKKPEGHWLWFIDYQYQEIGKKFLISRPELFFRFYDTFETLQPMNMGEPLGGGENRGFKSNWRR